MDLSLPANLAERTRWQIHPTMAIHPPGEFVLYWLHNAVRAHENPALDVAICLARQNGLPLLVYHGLCETYPYASDRHHAFMLQGARDVQREMSDRGIAYHFHLQRQGSRGPHLRDLTRRAAFLVTEEMPVPPLVGWIERLTCVTKTPIACVDSACIATPSLVDRPYTHPNDFRAATESLIEARVDQHYEEQIVDCEMFSEPMPFETMDLQRASLAKLIGQCRIDHSVGPVADTPGGSRAGYRRWDTFLSTSTAKPSSAHNRPTGTDASSRISPYLHYGMISPFRIARQAREAQLNRGANLSKLLDDLLVWREMAFHFCFHRFDDLDTFDALPNWSAQTLDKHESDQRAKHYCWEPLARGQTGQAFWDACQQSLLRHGELRDQSRVYWGKSLIPLVDSPRRALQYCIDLNHRYALDGRGPSSYGGILWCFGQFDDPSPSENSLFGSVRPRSTAPHQERADLDRFRSHVHRPIANNVPRVAVIGAGIAGLIAARTLQDHGIETKVFEKSRGVGGRAATRSVQTDDLETQFDHGAQYFTARDSRFARYVHSWNDDGLVRPWMGRIVEITGSGDIVDECTKPARFVGVPGMNAIGKHLASDLDVMLETQVSGLHRHENGRWQIKDQNDHSFGDFDNVIVNCPPVQAAALLRDHTAMANTIDSIDMTPCWAVMLAADGIGDVGFDGGLVYDHPLAWIARNDNKPGRPSGESSAWVLHATAQWTRDNLSREGRDVATELVGLFGDLIGRREFAVRYSRAHRWMYAFCRQPLDAGCLWDAHANLGVCGDWCLGGNIESAFLSGQALAGTMLRHLTVDRAAFKTKPSASVKPGLEEHFDA